MNLHLAEGAVVNLWWAGPCRVDTSGRSGVTYIETSERDPTNGTTRVINQITKTVAYIAYPAVIKIFLDFFILQVNSNNSPYKYPTIPASTIGVFITRFLVGCLHCQDF